MYTEASITRYAITARPSPGDVRFSGLSSLVAEIDAAVLYSSLPECNVAVATFERFYPQYRWEVWPLERGPIGDGGRCLWSLARPIRRRPGAYIRDHCQWLLQFE